MEKTSKIYQTYVSILKKELVPAMGCTEPVAIAYCAAKARDVLGFQPKQVEIYASGNIIKNVKSVIVPNSGGRKGLETAAALGILYGDADKQLQVISQVSQEQIESLGEKMTEMSYKVKHLESDHVLDMKLVLKGAGQEASVQIQDTHTNIVRIEKDGELLYENNESAADQENELDYDLLTVEEIYNFANEAELSDVKEVLLRQMECNVRIAEVGLKERYGAGIGKVIACRGDDARTQAVAYAAAASDARMGGCELPVVINSGSGNQGITASLPVIVYARYFRKSEEELLRALIVSNLVTLHLKSGIGRLSAYCGVVSAGVGAGAGIAYLLTKDRRVIEHEIVNAVAIASGMICDGAKPSCAAKIVMAVEAGILGFEMYEKGNQFYAGDGLVSKGVENTIHNISELGRDGMRETDKKIIQMMT
ncbi:MAG: serine dehydratase subunit alpha family protein [Lachnospiraceae bacterium]|nr:serine dehydratase subunit alpha family protein [Lachnospiraceae bacterium]